MLQNACIITSLLHRNAVKFKEKYRHKSDYDTQDEGRLEKYDLEQRKQQKNPIRNRNKPNRIFLY